MTFRLWIVDWKLDAHLMDRRHYSACGRHAADFDVCTRHHYRRVCPGCALVIECAQLLGSSPPPPRNDAPASADTEALY